MKNMIIIGAGEFADIAFEYFTVDSDYDVVAFSVEQQYITEREKFGLPVIPLEDIEASFPPDSFVAHVAVTSTQLNRVRARLISMTKDKGYELANFISPYAMVWRTANLGSNIFIFENNVVQHGTEIYDGCVLWSGNHIGHQTVIHENVFVSSQVVISGFCEIGARSFIGVNACFANGVRLGQDSMVGMGAVVNKSYADNGLLLSGSPAIPSKVSAYRYYKIEP